MHEWDEKAKEETVEAMKKMIRHLNQGSTEGVLAGILEVLNKEHRTLQQSFFRGVIAPVIKDFAEREYFDLRNEASVIISRKLKKILDQEAIPLI